VATYALTGSGVQALTAGTTRVAVDVTTPLTGSAFGQASPTNYFHLGLLRPGVGTGYAPVHAIDAAHIFVDLPAGATSLGYALFHGTAISVTEVIVGNPLRINLYTSIGLGPNANQTLWTYTVPAGRAVDIQMLRAGTQNGAGVAQNVTIAAGTTILTRVQSDTTASALLWLYSPVFDGLTLFPTEVVTATMHSAATAGITGEALMEGVEYDLATWEPGLAVTGHQRGKKLVK
jgi:hypothetical protein